MAPVVVAGWPLATAAAEEPPVKAPVRSFVSARLLIQVGMMMLIYINNRD